MPFVALLFAALYCLATARILPTSERVARGRPVTLADAAKSMAYIVSGKKGDRAICSASVIANSWILLAAHCKIAVGDLVRVGAHGSTVGIDRKVISFMRHHNYVRGDTSMVADVMVAKFGPPTTGAAIRLNWGAREPAPESAVYGFGYGRNEHGVAYVLRTARFIALASNTCRRKLRAATFRNVASNLNDSIHLCANERKVGAGICHGDSGGPLVMKRPGGFKQVGITLARFRRRPQDPCGDVQIPDAYTRVSLYRSWIIWAIGGKQTAGFLLDR